MFRMPSQSVPEKSMQEMNRGVKQPFRIDERVCDAQARLNPDPGRSSTVRGHRVPRASMAVAHLAVMMAGIAALVFPASAHASFLPPEMMDSVAMGVAWFVIVVIPIGAIVLFWMVHVLPEKIAHKRHHPQADAIHTLCLLSLVFGGMLWPFAWLWAYMKPVAYRSAYGTDKHENYFHHMGERALAGELQEYELEHLRDELDTMAGRGTLSADLKVLRKALASAEAAPAASRANENAPAASGAQTGGAA